MLDRKLRTAEPCNCGRTGLCKGLEFVTLARVLICVFDDHSEARGVPVLYVARAWTIFEIIFTFDFEGIEDSGNDLLLLECGDRTVPCSVLCIGAQMIEDGVGVFPLFPDRERKPQLTIVRFEGLFLSPYQHIELSGKDVFSNTTIPHFTLEPKVSLGSLPFEREGECSVRMD